MNFGRFDIVVLVTMSIAIVVISFMFPALGLAGSSNTTAAGDIPEFNVSASSWDIVGDFPDDPRAPSQGTLIWDQSQPGGGGQNQVWLQGDSNGGADTTIVNLGSSSDTNMTATLTFYNSTDFVTDNETFGSEGDRFSLTLDEGSAQGIDFNYTLEYEVTEYRGENTSEFYTEVVYTVTDQPGDDTSWLERIPIIGTIVSGGAELAAVVGWIGSVLYWFVASSVEVGLTIVVLLFDIMGYLVSLSQFLVGTYTGVIAAAESYASVVLLLPGILLFAEFAKIAMIGVSLLPFT